MVILIIFLDLNFFLFTISLRSLLSASKINVKKKLREYQKFIKENFEYVGENFAYEARSIHYNKNKSKKNIYGRASIEDVKELNEEGIETSTIPWIEDKEN